MDRNYINTLNFKLNLVKQIVDCKASSQKRDLPFTSSFLNLRKWGGCQHGDAIMMQRTMNFTAICE